MLRRGAILALGCVAAALPATAAAEPVTFAHGTIDSRYTTTQPGAPTGFDYTGDYHAAGDPSGDPPYMRRMTSYPPPGYRYDTSVPERCTASDLQLQLEGPSACPEGSRLGRGTARGKFMGEETQLEIDLFNNAGEQVMLVHTPLLMTVSRGKIAPDNSITFASPTCYPALVTCPADTALQMGSKVSSPPYVRDGRAYTSTPAKCPKAGHWQTLVRFWWADGTDDSVVTKQPCTRPAAKKKSKRRRR
jgi:hypothetical protein